MSAARPRVSRCTCADRDTLTASGKGLRRAGFRWPSMGWPAGPVGARPAGAGSVTAAHGRGGWARGAGRTGRLDARSAASDGAVVPNRPGRRTAEQGPAQWTRTGTPASSVGSPGDDRSVGSRRDERGTDSHGVLAHGEDGRQRRSITRRIPSRSSRSVSDHDIPSRSPRVNPGVDRPPAVPVTLELGHAPPPRGRHRRPGRIERSADFLNGTAETTGASR